MLISLPSESSFLNLSNQKLVFTKILKEQKEDNIKLVRPNVDHIITIDCSGSMYSELPKIRTQLKNKLSSLVAENDTVSIIWFSGRNEAGILKERVQINNLNDLSALHSAIDKFLKPVGLTGFVDPLKLVADLATKKEAGRVTSMFFVTDGYDNQFSEKDIIDMVEKMSSLVDNVTFVEYGYYCNKPLMLKMSEKSGANLIFSDSFENYEPIFESFITGTVKSAKKVEVDVQDPVNNLVFTFDQDNNLYTFIAKDNKVYVSEDFDNVIYLTKSNVNFVETSNDLSFVKPLLVATHVFAQRNKSDIVYDLLGGLQSPTVTKQYSTAFGKQALYTFLDNVKDLLNHGYETIFAEGRKNTVPADDAYCVIDLIGDLANDNAYWYPDHEDFVYNRIGAKKVSSKKVDPTLLATLEESVAKLKNEGYTKDDIQTITKTLSDIENKNVELKFKSYNKDTKAGFRTAVWNEKKPNISFTVKYNGYVELPANQYGIDKVDTFIYRNYTFIKDGLININKLPVSGLSNELFKKLSQEGIVDKIDGNGVVTLNIGLLPIMNRSMVLNLSAVDLAKVTYKMYQLKGTQKVVNHFFKEEGGKVSATFMQTYGEEATDWLKSLGITDYNGFSPKVEAEYSGDVYMATELDVKIPGLSSLPKVEDVENKVTKGGALKPAERLIEYGLNFYNSNKALDLSTLKEKVTEETRQVSQRISRLKFGLIVGQTWFKEFDSYDENSIDVELDGNTFNVKFDLKEVEVKL